METAEQDFVECPVCGILCEKQIIENHAASHFDSYERQVCSGAPAKRTKPSAAEAEETCSDMETNARKIEVSVKVCTFTDAACYTRDIVSRFLAAYEKSLGHEEWARVSRQGRRAHIISSP
jgi:hypothetical protein